ncbi:MAG: DNA mismatch repair protein MutS [Rikenellaceae bacterium]
MAKQEKKYVETPLMMQYYDIKAKHPDSILLFRVGDFYETFGEDAIKASGILGITLTRRANGVASYVELAGFPYHSLDTYLPKLVKAGERVAICEQLEDPKKTKKIVKRGVTELITPGVTYNDNTISYNEDNWLACVYFGKKEVGVAFLDITTGQFRCAEGSADFIEKLLSNYKPKEVLFQRGCKEQFENIFGRGYYLYHLEQWIFSETSAVDKLLKQFGVSSLKGFGIESLKSALTAAGAILYYLEFTEHNRTAHLQNISRIEESKNVWLDKFSLRNLELITPTVENGATLLKTLDHTKSPMGARNLRRWISAPIKDRKEIENRHNVVEFFINNKLVTTELQDMLSEIGDIERIISKVATARINPREFVQLKRSLRAVERIKAKYNTLEQPFIGWAKKLGDFQTLIEIIDTTILEEPATLIQKGGVIASGVSAELDSLRKISLGGKEYLTTIVKRESERTGIPSLKISYNNVFGYYIEVRNTHKDKVPEEWVRKQTLANAERYITSELKEYEEKILGAEDKILALEANIYEKLIEHVSKYISKVQNCAYEIGVIDTLQSFSAISCARKYCRPQMSDDNILDIKNGRHAVIESLMKVGESYIPNDVYLDNSEQQIIIITGPNMSGKSALLRQTALIVLMAQMGCFVPADSAKIGIVDKVFTRVGASDNISQGESTFMVEMLETANILNNATEKSLVLLDEIGRGTSTYDGISIAWAIVEYLHQNAKSKAKTLFATHYHELNDMESIYCGVKNYNVQVKEQNNRIIFLRKLVRGGTEHSFGIHVARMAAMPKSVVERASEILVLLEQKNRQSAQTGENTTKSVDLEKFTEYKGCEKYEDGTQLSLFALDDPMLYQVRDKIKAVDIDTMRPIDALNLLTDLKNLLGI